MPYEYRTLNIEGKYLERVGDRIRVKKIRVNSKTRELPLGFRIVTERDKGKINRLMFIRKTSIRTIKIVDWKL